jgi:hypothetical protein
MTILYKFRIPLKIKAKEKIRRLIRLISRSFKLFWREVRLIIMTKITKTKVSSKAEASHHELLIANKKVVSCRLTFMSY